MKPLRDFSRLLWLAGFSWLASCAGIPEGNRDLPTFRFLREGLAVGGQPSENGLHELKDRGFRTVVNFRHGPKSIQWEEPKVKALGMRYVSLPWMIWKRVNPSLLDRFFEVLDDPANDPVFFHCKHGRDRSGVMAVLVLMRYEGLTRKEAQDRVFGEVSPHWRYRYFVKQKIDFFLQRRILRAYPSGIPVTKSVVREIRSVPRTSSSSPA